MGHFADQAVADNFRRLAKMRLRPLPRAGLPDDFILLDGADDGLLFRNGFCQRLFALNLLSCVARDFTSCVTVTQGGLFLSAAERAGQSH